MRSISFMSVKRRRTIQTVARQALAGTGLLVLMTALPARAVDFNFDYSVSGASTILPVQVFDDGSHTYLQFASPTGMPHVVIIASDGQVVPFKIMPPYLVVNSLLTRFTLRDGNQLAEVASNRLPAAAQDAAFFAAPAKLPALSPDVPVLPDAEQATPPVVRTAERTAGKGAAKAPATSRMARPEAVKMAAAAKADVSPHAVEAADDAPLISVMTAGSSAQPLAGDPVAAAPLPEPAAVPATPLLAIDDNAASSHTAPEATPATARPEAAAPQPVQEKAAAPEAVAQAAPESVTPPATVPVATAAPSGPWQLTPGTLQSAFEALCQRYGYTLAWQVNEDKQHYVFDYPVTLPGSSFLKDVQTIDKMVNYDRHQFDIDVYEANKVLNVKGDDE